MYFKMRKQKCIHDWRIIFGPTYQGPGWNHTVPWQQVECLNCGQFRIEQAPRTMKYKYPFSNRDQNGKFKEALKAADIKDKP